MDYNFKKKVHNYLLHLLEQKISELRLSLDAAIESRNSDTKSSAGDKHETAREMIQQEVSIYEGELEKLKHSLSVISQINPEQNSTVVQKGAFVVTGDTIFYIAAGIGKVAIEGHSVYVVSESAPIVVKMTGLKVGQKFDMNGKTHLIERIL